MTVSGGEPTVCIRIHSGSRSRGQGHVRSHTCLDTNGYCDFSVLKEIARMSDVVLFDLKHLDPGRRLEKTGVNNSLILKNLELLCGTGSEIWIRIAVVRGSMTP